MLACMSACMLVAFMLACMSACMSACCALAAEVGFDEATQKTVQRIGKKRKAPDDPTPAEKSEQRARRVRLRKKTCDLAFRRKEPVRHSMEEPSSGSWSRSELSHSFVSSAHFCTCDYTSAGRDACHKLVLPARRVSSTDHNSIGSALVASIECTSVILPSKSGV